MACCAARGSGRGSRLARPQPLVPRRPGCPAAARCALREAPLALSVLDCRDEASLEGQCAALRVETFHPYAPSEPLYGPLAALDEARWTQARLAAELARGPRLAALGMLRVRTLAACEAGGGPPLALGTLDLHVGDRLPGEPLEGGAAQAVPPVTLLSVGGDGATLGARAAYARLPLLSARPLDLLAPLIGQPLPPPPEAYAPPRGAEPGPLEVLAEVKRASAAAARPSGWASAGARAYVFNLAVSPGARRRGAGRALLRAAAAEAAAAGVRTLYVHVEAGNEAARALYVQTGFRLEGEEPEWLAARLGRPRRLLLAKPLT